MTDEELRQLQRIKDRIDEETRRVEQLSHNILALRRGMLLELRNPDLDVTKATYLLRKARGLADSLDALFIAA